METTDGKDRLGNMGQSAGKMVKGGRFGLGPVVPKIGPVLGEAQFRSRLGGESYKSAYEVAQVHGPMDVRPIILKGWQLGCEERPFYIKGSFMGCEGLSEMGFRHVIEGIKGVRGHSLSEEAEMEVRAIKEDSRARVREDAGVACYHGGDWRVSEAFSTKARALITDEALTAESSRYEPYLADFGGGPGLLLFYSFFWV